MVRTHTFTAATDSEVATDGGEDTDSETGTVATRTPHLTVVPEDT